MPSSRDAMVSTPAGTSRNPRPRMEAMPRRPSRSVSSSPSSSRSRAAAMNPTPLPPTPWIVARQRVPLRFPNTAGISPPNPSSVLVHMPWRARIASSGSSRTIDQAPSP